MGQYPPQVLAPLPIKTRNLPLKGPLARQKGPLGSLTLFAARAIATLARHNQPDKLNPQCAYKRGHASDAPVRVAS